MAQTGFLSVKNFERFQHYKDRDPPWIRLYVRILDDYEFARLPDAQKAHLVMLWILASKTENRIPADAEWIGKRISASESVDLAALQEIGFLQPWTEGAPVGKREGWASRYVSAQTRADVLSASGGHCAQCPSDKNLEIDHIIPVSRGGTGDMKNLQVLCRQCNRRKRTRLRAESAEHMRSEPLRRTSAPRTPEAEAEESRGETEKNLSAASAAKLHSNGNGDSHGPEQVKQPPGKQATWVQEAAGIYAAHIGIIPHGLVGRILKPVVDLRGWDEVRRVMEHFCAVAPFEEYLQRCEAGTLRQGEEKAKKMGYNTTLKALVERYTYWADKVGIVGVA